MMDAANYLQSHRAHDVSHLLARWAQLARTLRLKTERLCRSGRYDVICLESKGPSPGLYLSAGIHGDEPGATEGLFRWAARDGLADLMRRGVPFFVAPCLNPWGLANNRRVNGAGIDLNRKFCSRRISPVRQLHKRVLGARHRLALTLHEDYDAQGLYLYEIPGPRPYWGEKLAAAVAHLIPPDPRPEIESRRARRGIIRPRVTDALTRKFLRRGCPEALWLHTNGHAERTFTFETPSEFDLDRRADTQATLVTEAIRLAFGSPKRSTSP